MFKQLSQKIFNKKKGEIVEYEGPIQKRIVLLGHIRNLAIGIVNDCTAITKTFNQEEGPLYNIAENLAINMKMMATAMKGKDEEYANFLLKLQAAYDEIGRAQRKFSADLKEQVIDPLNAWLLTDYKRMNGEISRLNEKKLEMDKANENRAGKKEQQIIAEQTVKEFERQMEIVKLELLKLSTIKNEHAGLFYNFLELYKIYHQAIDEVFNQCGADKWVSSITGVS